MPQERIYSSAAEILARRRSTAEARAADRRAQLYEQLPQLRRFDADAAAICRRMTAAAMEGDNKGVAHEKGALELLQQQRDAFLQEAGVTEGMLRPQYTCPLCEDTGYKGGKRCRCLTQLLQEQASLQLPCGVLAACGGFDRFDLTYYSDQLENGRSPRETMRNILGRCREYATGFGRRSGNLLFIGRTGLGKTYLSVSIAQEVLSQGFSVQYYPAQAMIDRFERVRFSRDATPQDQAATREILSADLLILDDLGAEFISSFSQSVLYHVINERLVEGLPTIISTNLDPAQLSQVYSERIVSRLIGSYTLYGFVGRDIRQQMQSRRHG